MYDASYDLATGLCSERNLGADLSEKTATENSDSAGLPHSVFPVMDRQD